MQVQDLSNKVTSYQLNESLAKKFGYRFKLDELSDMYLEKAHTKLSESIREFERKSSFDSVHESREYQKTRAMLDVVRKAIAERALSPQQSQKREKFIASMQSKVDEFAKRYGERAEEVMYETATRMAKQKSLDKALGVLRESLSVRTLTEGEEEKAALIMSSRDMVDKVTSWLEDVASMKTETMLDLTDSIRDEMGNDVAEQFTSTIKPALEELYNSLEAQRTVMAQSVAILTGEEGPGGMPGAGMPPVEGGVGGEEMPATMAAPGAEEELPMPDMPAEPEARVKRESVEMSRKLGTMLSSKKK